MSALTYTCFRCFQECVAEPPLPEVELRCSGCGAVVASGAAAVSVPQFDFGITDRDRQALTAERVAAAYEAQAQENALLRAIMNGM